jgi:hypothetical protein
MRPFKKLLSKGRDLFFSLSPFVIPALLRPLGIGKWGLSIYTRVCRRMKKKRRRRMMMIGTSVSGLENNCTLYLATHQRGAQCPVLSSWFQQISV